MKRACGTAALLLALAAPCAPHAEEAAAPQQCWTEQALAGTDAERKHQRNRGPLDVEALRQTAIPPAIAVPPELRGSIRSVDLHGGVRLIALTFDLCEENGYVFGYDGRIVDYLRAQGVKATFFAGGKWMESHPERTAQLIADPLFEVGAHGLRHRDMSQLGDEMLKEEIVLTDAAYARAKAALAGRQCLVGEETPKTGARLTLLRFPYGSCNPKALAAAADAGQLAIQWDVVAGDPGAVPAKAIANRILARAHPGAIVVAHANGRGIGTSAALAIVVPKLKEEGYSFVTVSELLAAGKPVIASACYLNAPGDLRSIPRYVARKGGKARVARSPGGKSKHAPLSIFSRRN
jgi:peptidoglycan/xylan/chitin deacetylase (PgdA/CDA1 family)